MRTFAIMKTHGTKQTVDVPNEIFRSSQAKKYIQRFEIRITICIHAKISCMCESHIWFRTSVRACQCKLEMVVLVWHSIMLMIYLLSEILQLTPITHVKKTLLEHQGSRHVGGVSTKPLNSQSKIPSKIPYACRKTKRQGIAW